MNEKPVITPSSHFSKGNQIPDSIVLTTKVKEEMMYYTQHTLPDIHIAKSSWYHTHWVQKIMQDMTEEKKETLA